MGGMIRINGLIISWEQESATYHSLQVKRWDHWVPQPWILWINARPIQNMALSFHDLIADAHANLACIRDPAV